MSRTYNYFKRTLFYLFLAAYILLLAKALLFKQVSLFDLFNAERIISRTLNLIPLKTILEYTHFNIWIALMNVVGNIALFIPFGIYLQIFKKNKNILSCVALVCVGSLCVEVVQYGFGIGSADIDDIILNTLGGLLGILIYRILYMLLKDEDKTRTAATYLFCFVSAGFGVCFFVLVHILGYRVRIF